MSLSAIFIQLLNGLASASSLFLVAAGLSLIFGVTRIVNFAHGSLYMLGAYIAYSLVNRPAARDPRLLESRRAGAPRWPSACSARWSRCVLLRRIYRAPELLQLLATFALVLIVRTLPCWPGARTTCSARARPGCAAPSTSPAARFRTTTCS